MKPVNNLLNQIFGRLTVLSRAINPGTRKNDTAAYWNCQCSCGTLCVIRGYSLTTNKTKSCGCLKLEAPHLPLLPQAQPKYDSHEASARQAWRNNNRYTDLSFEDFYRLSQLNCFYCNNEPSLIKIKKRKNPEPFLRNTLDRIDSLLGHTIDNVVPACLMCNVAKLDRSLQDFYIYINNLINNLDRLSPSEYRYQSSINELVSLSSLYSYKQSAVKALYTDYHDGELNLTQFYELIMSNCYYCGMKPSNTRNMSSKQSSEKAKTEGTILYNGLDRIDNNLPHDYDNVVPCCKYCNTAKSQLSVAEFDSWVKRLATHSRPFF